jgi:hypothetical protein
MLISYSDSTKEILIEFFDKKDIEEFQLNLLENQSTLYCQNECGRPSPYSRYLHSLEVQIVPGQAIQFSVDSNNLVVCGDLSKLAILSENVEGLEETPINYHLHIEYFGSDFDDDYYVSSNSLPIVITHACL